MDDWTGQLTAALTGRPGTLDWCRHYFRIVMEHPPLLAALYANTAGCIEKRSVDQNPHSVSIHSSIFIFLSLSLSLHLLTNDFVDCYFDLFWYIFSWNRSDVDT